jgi:hypothetical protein
MISIISAQVRRKTQTAHQRERFYDTTKTFHLVNEMHLKSQNDSVLESFCIRAKGHAPAKTLNLYYL